MGIAKLAKKLFGVSNDPPEKPKEWLQDSDDHLHWLWCTPHGTSEAKITNVQQHCNKDGKVYFEARRVKIPEMTRGRRITVLGTGALYAKEEITLPSTLRVIEKQAFRKGEFKTLQLPNSLNVLEHGAFEDCWKLEKISLPNSLVTITGNPFIRCTNLASIYVEPKHEVFATIDGVLFHKQEKKLVSYPPNREAFHYEIPKGIKSIGADAFGRCGRLSEIAIPASVETIEGNPFVQCPILKKITVAEDNPFFSSIDGVLYNKSGTRLIAFPSDHRLPLNDVYQAPETTKTIGVSAFEGVKRAISILLPEGMEDIEAHAFAGCQKLKSVRLSSTLKRIGEKAFADIRGMQEIVIPENVQEIGREAFLRANNLKSVDFRCRAVQLEEGVFALCYDLESAAIPEGWKEIPRRMFYRAFKLKNITLPSTLTSIEAHAFGNTAIGRIRIPDQTSNIGEKAFHECPQLTFITPPGSYADMYGRYHGILTAAPDDLFWLDA